MRIAFDMSRIVKLTRTQPPLVRDSHIIPRFYLNRFADSGKRLFVYTRNLPCRIQSTKSLCTERDYFEYDFARQKSLNKHEVLLSALEDKAAKTYPKLMSSRPLDGEEPAFWAMFVASLFIRTRKVREQMTPGVLEGLSRSFFGIENITKMQYELFQKGHLHSKEDIYEAASKTYDQMRLMPAFLHFARLEERIANLAPVFTRKIWHTLHAAPGLDFVTSDNPVFSVKLDQQGAAYPGYGFAHDDVTIMLPLSPKFLFVASPPSLVWEKSLDEPSTRTINRIIIACADRAVFARHKITGLQELVDNDLNSIIYGQNAYTTNSSI